MKHVTLASAVVGFVAAVGFSSVLHGDQEIAKPSAQVRDALRQLLSSDAKEEARGEARLRRMGAAIMPQLRYWVRKVRTEAQRVEVLLLEMEGEGPLPASAASMLTNEFFHRKLYEARELLVDGEHQTALQIVEAILVLDPENPYGWQMRRLARNARQSIASAELLEPSVTADRVAFEVHEKPKVFFRLANRSRKTVRIALNRGFVADVDMTVTRRFQQGAMRSERRKLAIRLEGDELIARDADDEEIENGKIRELVLDPGQTWERAVPLEIGKNLPLFGFIARVQLTARFRPARWGTDGTEGGDLENISIQTPVTELWVVPPGQADLCERPIEKLTAALLFGQEEPLFVAGWLTVWAAETDAYLNEKLLSTLISHLAELDATRLRLATAFLKAATWKDFGPDPEAWKSWWKRRTQTPEPIESGSVFGTKSPHFDSILQELKSAED